MSSSSEIDKTETVDNEAEKDVSAPPRKKLLTEAMRDIFVSTLLVILTILITQADFQKSPTSSLLASGKKNLRLYFILIIFSCMGSHFIGVYF